MLLKSDSDIIKMWWGHVPTIPSVNDTYGFFIAFCLNLQGATGLHSFVWIKVCREPNPEVNLSY